MTIREILKEIVLGDGVSAGIAGINFLAVVESVDVAKYNCSVKIIGTESILEDVRLKAEFEKKYGIAVVPKKGSFVIVTMLSMAGSYVSLCSEVEKIEMQIDNSKLQIDNDGFVFNGGSLGGMVKIEELVKKLNALEKQMGTHQHLYIPVSGTPIPTTPDAATNAPIVPTQKTELENVKIKQ